VSRDTIIELGVFVLISAEYGRSFQLLICNNEKEGKIHSPDGIGRHILGSNCESASLWILA